MEKTPDQEAFTLGTPAVVCRWRLAAGRLPLENRHLRALSQRAPKGTPVSDKLVAWAKQHIEWTLASGAALHPDGVLMTIVDEEGQAAMTVGPYEALASTATADLARRALDAAAEAVGTGVAPETLWGVREGVLVWGINPGDHPSGAATLVSDLAATLGMTVVRDPQLAQSVADSGRGDLDEVFLVSDEHGVVPASDAQGQRAERFAAGYEKLLETTRRR